MLVDSVSAGKSGREASSGVSPFIRLRRLLAGSEPHRAPIDLALGEPRMAVPPWVAAALTASQADLARYPAIRGTPELREAIAAWLSRDGSLPVPIDPECHVLPCLGSREGMFMAILHAVRRHRGSSSPAVLFPDPAYPVYAAAATVAGAEAVPLPARAAHGQLPDLAALEADGALLARTAALIIGTPANPQGAIADPAYLACAARLARSYDFTLISDECYSEVYSDRRPVSALTCSASYDNLLVFNSLSKRSGLPGLRSGFCAGDPALIESLGAMRNLVGPQMPGPLQHASALVWRDETIVELARERHLERIAAADRLLGAWPGYHRPAGGFFLWLDVSPWDGVEFARSLWSDHGVRILPGSFLAHGDMADEIAGYVRIALVDELATVVDALGRIADLLAKNPEPVRR